MSKSSFRRADDPDLNSGEPFKPGADPDEWIEQLSAPYRERPAAVLRELVQNANDAVQKSGQSQRFIEVAVLSERQDLDSGSYHLAVRDSGNGMSEAELRSELGILGFSTKRNEVTSIGEFGVGFYSTHAICREVGIVSKKAGSGSITAWVYRSRDKTWQPMPEDFRARLLEGDLEKHPMPTRR